MENQEEKSLINARYGEVVGEMFCTAIPAEPNIGELAGLFDEGGFYDLPTLKNKHGERWAAISGVFREYLTHGGGKRQRPLLALAGYKTFSGGKQLSQKIIDTAVGVELLHETALILDDVMDNSTTRRGAPSLWADIINKTAVNENEAKQVAVEIAPLCFAWSRYLVADGGGAEEVFWRVVDEMKRGQILDVKSTRENKWPELEEAIEWEYLKTATYSIELPLLAALRIAEVAEDKKEKSKESIKIFARSFGIALQLNDDLLVFKTNKEIGKESMADAINGNKIPLVIIARQMGFEEQKNFIDTVWGHSDKLTAENIEKLKHIFRETGALKNVSQKILEEIKNAENALQEIKELGFDITPLNYLIEIGHGWVRGVK